MPLYSKNGATPRPLPQGDYGTNRDGKTWWFEPLSEMTNEQLATLGWIPAPDVPLYNPRRQEVSWDGTKYVITALSGAKLIQGVIEEKARLYQLVDAAAREAILKGYSPSLAVFNGEHLQLRNADDKTNWLMSANEYTNMINQGQGEVQGAVFRTAENNNITCTYGQGLVAIRELQIWFRSIVQHMWKLKDDIKASNGFNYDEGLIQQGWPA